MRTNVRRAATGPKVRLHDLEAGQCGYSSWDQQLFMRDRRGRLFRFDASGILPMKNPITDYINYPLELVSSIEVSVTTEAHQEALSEAHRDGHREGFKAKPYPNEDQEG